MFEVAIDHDSFVYLKDKVVIITGASSGIGLATTKFFSEHGSLIYAADINPLPHGLPNVKFVKTDLTTWSEQLALFTEAFTVHKRIDIAFLNAGVGEVEDVFVDRFDDDDTLREPQYRVLQVNLLAPLNGTKLATHFMRKQKGPGSIVITGSGKSFNGVGGTPMYAVAKHGLLGLIRTLRTDMPRNIRINLVCPFWTDTGIVTQDMKDQNLAAQRSMQPAVAVSYAVAHLSLHSEFQGTALYVAGGKYVDTEKGFLLTRPIWLGAQNHLDRIVGEDDPSMANFRTKFE